MNIVIVGCGKTGSRLASELSDLGFDVAVVDSEKSSFQRLRDDFDGLCVSGVVNDITVLRNAGCDNADAAVVVTDNDNLNVMVARMLELEFGVKDVLVRIHDPSRESVFRKFGLRTVCATRIESDVFLSLLTDRTDEVDSIRIGGSAVHFTMEKADRKEIGKSLSEIKCPHGKMPFAIKRKDGSVLLYNESKEVISEGDKIIFALL